jgi:ATP-dependent Lon protease
MTGEISLRGLILPIGGLKEKTLGAMRAGLQTVLIPKLNEKDLPDIPSEAKEKLKILPVETVDELLDAALERPPKPVADDDAHNNKGKSDSARPPQHRLDPRRKSRRLA